jgi:hypothetical protein
MASIQVTPGGYFIFPINFVHPEADALRPIDVEAVAAPSTCCESNIHTPVAPGADFAAVSLVKFLIYLSSYVWCCCFWLPRLFFFRGKIKYFLLFRGLFALN